MAWSMSPTRPFNRSYEGKALDHLHFPIGGLGSGMFTLDGAGAFSNLSFRHRPDLFNESIIFSALAIKHGDGATTACVLEGPVPPWKFFFPWDRLWDSSGMGGRPRTFGLPRFDSASFASRFPFGTVSLSDPNIPLEVSLTGWNPFIPGDTDASSLPVGSISYRFKNNTAEPIEAVYSFHAKNIFAGGETGQSVKNIPGGFHLRQDGLPDKPAAEASLAAWIDDPQAVANTAWFRGGWSDGPTMLWKEIEQARAIQRDGVTDGKPSPGGSLYLSLQLAPGEEKTVRLLLAWYVPFSELRAEHPPGEKTVLDPKTDFYRPWYATRFKDIGEVVSYWTANEEKLRHATETFTNCFYDSSLPPEVIEAVAANLTILKSTTVLRQYDGRMWAWEGSKDEEGSCAGTCTHVWNYAQALCHLFPDLERTLRETEFTVSQDERGHQAFRSSLPIGQVGHSFHAASDGQLGGLLKVYRDWRISGDTEWLRKIWPRVRQSLDYCIETWDPSHRGALFEPHHNTYDIEFWGPDGMCSSFYLAALHAATAMGRALGDDIGFYEKLLAAGRTFVETELFNGDYFFQKIQWKGLRAADPIEACKVGVNMDYSPEARELLEVEGPKYQYGEGCLSDGILGEWMAWTAGLSPALTPGKIEKHLLAIHRHNFRSDLATLPNPQRPSYAFGHEAGLLLCTWPRGGKLSLPFPYSEEVWTGIEYQVASHLISFGHVEEGLEIVRACRRRYDGNIRNPFDEIECGHWYARAMASYALLQALTGARYDAIERTLYLEPKIQGDFRSFLATATGFGTVGLRNGQPFLEVRAGHIDVDRIEYKK